MPCFLFFIKGVISEEGKNFVQSLVGCEMFFSKTEENRGNGILIKPQEKGATGRQKD
jgi:hypothetical protein